MELVGKNDWPGGRQKRMKYVWTQSGWLPVVKHAPWPSPAPYIISDHMQPLRHQATGQMFDSKSAFRAATRAAGCVELGNDAPREPQNVTTDPKDVRADVVEALRMVEQGCQPAPLAPAAPDTRIYQPPID